MGWFTSTREFDPGRSYTPHKPWALLMYRGGGGLPKTIDFYETQALAAYNLRQNIADEDRSEDRYVLIHHVTGPRDVRRLFDSRLSRSDYHRLALIQYRAHNAMRARSWGVYGSRRRASRTR